MKLPRESIVFKSLFGIIFLLTVFSVIVGTIGYKGYTDALLEQYAAGAFRTADAAALALDPDRMEEYKESEGKSDEYQSAWKSLDWLCNSQDATFVYVIQPDQTDYGHITFLFSTINRDSTYTKYEFGYVKETTNEEYREKYRELYEDGLDRALVIRDKGYIETDPHITAMVPLKGTDQQTKAILCVQRQMDTLTQARHDYARKVLLALIGIAIIVIVGQGFYLHKVLLSPVKQITDEASRFAGENVATDRKLTDTIRNRDEIGTLAGAIDRMEEQIHDYIGDLTRITAEKERISTELTVATRIQEGVLPNIFPAFPEHPEFDIFASMDPAREVGGDFYDFFLIDADHLCMVMADVSGKGIPAALFMMASKIILENHAKMNKSPREILESTNTAICLNNHEQMFVTVWLGILEISAGKVTAANAGHEYPVVMNAGGRFELMKDKHGFVIGGMEDMRYEEYEFQMEPGSKLFLYTDGVTEATDEAQNMFGLERMLEALNANAEANPQGILRGVREAVDSFIGEAEQFDDLTMLCMEYKGPSSFRRKERNP